MIIKVYLSGPAVDEKGQSQAVAMQSIKAKLEAKGFHVFSSPPKKEYPSFEEEAKKRIEKVIKSDVLITCEHWYNDQLSILEVDIARRVNIPIKHFTLIHTLSAREPSKY